MDLIFIGKFLFYICFIKKKKSNSSFLFIIGNLGMGYGRSFLWGFRKRLGITLMILIFFSL